MIKLSSVLSSMRKHFPGRVPDSLDYIPYGVSTQSLRLDLAIGRPGVPAGRMTQITGLDGHGKSSICIHLIAETMLLGGHAALLDLEKSYERSRVSALARKVLPKTAVQPLEPYNLEEAYKMAIEYMKGFRKNNPVEIPLLMVLDSLDGLPPEAIAEADSKDKFVGLVARINGQWIPPLLTTCGETKTILVLVSQLNTKIGGGGYRPSFLGPEYDTKGGLSPKYRAILRMHVKRKAYITENKEKLGHLQHVECIKNKLAPPFKVGEYNFLYDRGIDQYRDLFDAAEDIGYLRHGRIVVQKEKISVNEDTWIATVDVLGGVRKMRQRITRYALRTGFLKAFGQEEEIVPAESYAEREPSE